MPNLALLKLLAIAALAAALFGFGWSMGSEHVEAKWNLEKAELNAQAAKELDEANARVRKTEQAARDRLAQTEHLYLDKLKDKSNEETLALTRARSGGLHINAKCPNTLDTVSNPTELATGRDGETRVELPREDGEFLIRLAAEADRVTEQLTTCQAILESERAQ